LIVEREQRPTYGEPPTRGGTLRLLRPPSSRDDLNPASFRQDYQVPVSYLDPLLRPGEVTLEPGPWLAERWVWSESGRVLTYTLRQGVTFHDGAPLSAVDVAFSFYVYRDDVDSAVRNLFASMVAAEALDDRTVRVTLAQPDGGWLFGASTQFVFQRRQYAPYWESRPVGERTLTGFDWAGSPPLGTGPWRLSEWDDAGVTFDRNGDYWAGAPAFDRLTIGWEADAAERLAAWREGEADVVWPVTPDDVERLAAVDGRLYVADAASVMFAAFNFANPARPDPGIFADVRVRRALSLAIDRDRYAEEVFGGFIRQRAAGTFAQPWANDPELTTPRQDRDLARDLLFEAGWSDLDGDGTLDDALGQPFVISVLLRDDARPELEEVLRSVRRDLREVGVQLAIESLDGDAFEERWLVTHDFDLIAFAYDLYPGFTDFDLYGSAWDVRENPQGFNPGGYRNPVVDAAIDAALVAVDVGRQRELLVELQREADDDLFALWFGFPRQLVLVRPDVLGFQPNKLWQTADTRKLWRASEPGE
jgi:peptide/nickel transport system substrate-binding protein